MRIFGAYLRERFRPAVFGPAIALLVAAALWANGGTAGIKAIIQAAGLSTLLLVQFRLWDDLEDCARDRIEHPERLLVRTEQALFRRALAALFLMNIALVAASGSRISIAGLIVLDLIFWLAYRRIRAHIPEFVWRFQILLFKYPAFVVLVAAVSGMPNPTRLAAAALAAYGCACACEFLHDRRTALGAIS